MVGVRVGTYLVPSDNKRGNMRVTEQGLFELARLVGRELTDMTGSEWTFDRDHSYSHRPVLVSSGGARRVGFRTIAYTDRVEITGNYADGERDADGEIRSVSVSAERPKITVNGNRDPKAIARDIVRRFLPGYDAAQEQIVNAITQRMTRNAETRRTVAHLYNALGIPPAKRSSDPKNSRVSWLPSGPGFGRIEVNGDSVSMDLSGLTPELAVEIAQLLFRREEQPLRSKL